MKKFSIKVDNQYLAKAFIENLRVAGIKIHDTANRTGWIEATIGSEEVSICSNSWDSTGVKFTLPNDYQQALEYVINYFKKEPTYKVGDVVIASIGTAVYIGKYNGIDNVGSWKNILLTDWTGFPEFGFAKTNGGHFEKVDRLATAEEIEKYNLSGLKEGDYLYIIKGTSWVKTNEVIKLGGEYIKNCPISKGNVTAITKAYPRGNSGVSFKHIQYRKATTEEANRFELSLLKAGDWVAKVWKDGAGIDIFKFDKVTGGTLYCTSTYYTIRKGRIDYRGTPGYAGIAYDERMELRLATQAEIDFVSPKNITLTLAGKDVTVTKDSVRIAGHDVDMSSIRVLYGRFKSIDESSCAGYAVQLAIDVPIFKCGCQGVFSIQDLRKVLQAADSLS